MLPSRLYIICYRILCIGLIISTLSACFKHRGDGMGLNISVPQHNHIAVDLLTNFLNVKHIESIEKFNWIEGVGLYYMGKNSNQVSIIGKLSTTGLVNELSNFAYGYPIDFIQGYGYLNNNPTPNFYFYTVGQYGNSSPILCRYRPDDGSPRNIYHMGAALSINASCYDPWGQKLYFGGENTNRPTRLYRLDARPTVPNLTDALDSIPIPGNNNISNISNIETGVSNETVFLVCDSIAENVHFSVVKELNLQTHEVSSIEGSAIPLPEKQKILTAKQGDKLLIMQTSDTLTPSLSLSYRIIENGSIESKQPEIPVLSGSQIIFDVIMHNDIIYACGIANNTNFRVSRPHAGNALLLKIEGGKATAFTFGDASYLSAFKHMQIVGQKIYLSGLTKQYVSPLDESQWHSAYSFSQPYFVSIDLDKLK